MISFKSSRRDIALSEQARVRTVSMSQTWVPCLQHIKQPKCHQYGSCKRCQLRYGRHRVLRLHPRYDNWRQLKLTIDAALREMVFA